MNARNLLVAIFMAILLFTGNSASAEYCQTPSANVSPSVEHGKSTNPSRYREAYKQSWSILQKRFLFRDRMSSWSTWEHKFDRELTTQAETEAAINKMVDSLKDPYTYFLNAKETQEKDLDSTRTGVVTYELLPDNIGYIKISTFGSRNTTGETEAALTALKSADALIIDLRNNHGGYVDEAIHVASLLIERGPFCAIEEQVNAKTRQTIPLIITNEHYTNISTGELNCKHAAAISSKTPIVILVNKDTASASEMLAGCLQENKRAKVIGAETTGKGICQDSESLPLGTSIRFTYSYWHLPLSGKCIHKSGLTPDVELTRDEMANAKRKAVEFLRNQRSNNAE